MQLALRGGRPYVPPARQLHPGQPRRPAAPLPPVRLLGARSGRAGAGREAGDTALEKEAWVSTVLLEWGICGKLAYVDGVPAGYVMFAPPAYVPRSVAFPTSPVSPDAVLLMTAPSSPEFAGRRARPDAGAGRRQGPAAARGQAVEAFGDLRWERPDCMLRPSTCWRWASRRSGRTRASPAAAGAADRAVVEVRCGVCVGEAARVDEPADGARRGHPVNLSNGHAPIGACPSALTLKDCRFATRRASA